MSDDIDENDQRRSLDRTIQAMKDRGHASMLARPRDKKDLDEEPGHWLKIVERSVAREWANSMRMEFGVEIANIRSNPNDPPDCIGEMNGQEIGIEVTEIVKGAT